MTKTAKCTMWGIGKRVSILLALMPAVAGTVGAPRDSRGTRGDVEGLVAVGGLQIWPNQKAVLVSLYRNGWHEDHLVALGSGATLWSQRQKRGQRGCWSYFGPVSPDGRKVLVFYYRGLGDSSGHRATYALGLAETALPNKVKRVWKAPDPQRMIEVMATWSPKGDAIWVYDVEKNAFAERARPYVVRVVAVDPTVESQTHVAVMGLRHEARILGFWCPPVSPRSCSLVLSEFVPGDRTPVYRVPFDWPSGFQEFATLQRYVQMIAPSRDGRKVAVLSYNGACPGFRLSILRGEDLRPVWQLPRTLNAPFWHLSWNRQGTRLVGFASADYGAPFSGLWLVDVAKRRMRPLGDVHKFVGRATWAPDDRTVVFSSGDRVMTIDVDTQQTRQLWRAPDIHEEAARPSR